MADISMDEINKLIDEVLQHITDEEIYENAMKHINPVLFEKWAKNPPSAQSIGTAFALAGFMDGIKYTLLNIEIKEEGE